MPGADSEGSRTPRFPGPDLAEIDTISVQPPPTEPTQEWRSSPNTRTNVPVPGPSTETASSPVCDDKDWPDKAATPPEPGNEPQRRSEIEPATPDDPVEEDEFAPTEGYDTRTTGSTSVTSSIYAHNYEHGRRYQYFKHGRYPIPNDNYELDREDMKHAMLKELTDGLLFYAPIGDDPQTILDIGTGTGRLLEWDGDTLSRPLTNIWQGYGPSRSGTNTPALGYEGSISPLCSPRGCRQTSIFSLMTARRRIG